MAEVLSSNYPIPEQYKVRGCTEGYPNELQVSLELCSDGQLTLQQEEEYDSGRHINIHASSDGNFLRLWS